MCYAPYCHSRWQSIVVVLYRREFITPDSRALEEATNQQLARPAAGRRHRYLLWLPAARGSSLDPFPIEPSVTTPRQTGINQEKNQSITRTYAQAHAGISARVSVATPRFLSHYSCRAAPLAAPATLGAAGRQGRAARGAAALQLATRAAACETLWTSFVRGAHCHAPVARCPHAASRCLFLSPRLRVQYGVFSVFTAPQADGSVDRTSTTPDRNRAVSEGAHVQRS